MSTITHTLTHEHTKCDALFAQAELLVSQTQWDKAVPCVEAFIQAMEHHFAKEENLLFPTFEARTGQTMGPTQIMRMEHQQMRQLFAEMQQSATQHESEEYLGQAETLLMLMRQHNVKEEQILYPMTDDAFTQDRDTILQQLQNYSLKL